ncbi:MAG: N(4)-(beta-N-acetylglucosaminyl)-L-asparaginase [Ignavibacteriales bacterium]|nr:N(4)-(beta-N-acetylglucosaminyl)-L-asparaginase [Ignavibacteriales bacterium]
MKITRRDFVKAGALVSGGLMVNQLSPSNIFGQQPVDGNLIAVSTWGGTIKSTEKAFEYLKAGKNSLDALEAGIRVAEDDPTNSSVGYGGFPDEDGIVTLDASVMDWNGNAGSVGCIEGIKNPISVAKLVMQRTKHVMLVGDGAKKFALQNGFKEENLLTENSRQAWEKWKKENPHGVNRVDEKNHDTIGLLAIDNSNNLSGGVSTSGMAWKIHGRVGDSPIIGAGMFVDNEFGGAVATGNGEFVMRTVGSFLVVEKMRDGLSPQEACEFAIKRIYKTAKNNKDIQIGYLAINKKGDVGAFSLYDGFTYALTNGKESKVVKSEFLTK